MKIKDIGIRRIFDSRGNATVEFWVEPSGGEIRRAQVPAGKSRGAYEAAVFEYAAAVRAVAKLKRSLIGRSYDSQTAWDSWLIDLDGTSRKTKYGGNTLLGLSVAFSRALAASQKQEPWEALRSEFYPNIAKRSVVQPFIFSNLINGGAHAENGLAIQEYMVIVKPGPSLERTVVQLIGFYRALGRELKRQIKSGVLPIGDEGGYALPFKDTAEPIYVIARAIRALKLQRSFRIGLDAAATNFYRGGKYHVDKRALTPTKLVELYEQIIEKEPLLVSIEDPFRETAGADFRALQSAVPDCMIVGDDLTTTDPERIVAYGADGTIRGVIVKPNQVGTVSETCAAIAAADLNGVQSIVSHRSGETEDAFIIQIARAANVFGVKIGAPARERVAKFNELLRLYWG